jgi:hypothetical protein
MPAKAGIQQPSVPWHTALWRKPLLHEGIMTTSHLGKEVRHALQQSRHLIVICSPNAAVSRWVDEETLSYAVSGGEFRARFIDHEGREVLGQEGLRYLWYPWALEHKSGLVNEGDGATFTPGFFYAVPSLQ